MWLSGCALGLALVVSLAGSAEAHRKAAVGESNGMWRVIEREQYTEDCVRHRARISTAHTPHRKYGIVLVADRKCGNGQVVLAKRRGTTRRWRILGSGSDWGFPERCASDLRKVPRRVLEDFFGSDFCSDYRVAPTSGRSLRRCGWMHGRDDWKAKITATEIRCHKARRILRYWFEEGPGVHYHPEGSESWTLERYPGWRCGFGAGAGACSKGNRVAGYQSLFNNRSVRPLVSEARSQAVEDPSTWRLGPRGIGPLRLGMSAARARAVVPSLRIEHSRFCDSWSVPGLDSVSLLATHSRGALSAASISGYAEDPQIGHGAGGVELGESLRALKQRFGKRLKFVKRIGSLQKSFYRLYARPGGRHTAVEFTINTSAGLIDYQEAGFLGGFYYTDGNELCG
jgi:hypothetical protein